jgi:hypothetical protein
MGALGDEVSHFKDMKMERVIVLMWEEVQYAVEKLDEGVNQLEYVSIFEI